MSEEGRDEKLRASIGEIGCAVWIIAFCLVFQTCVIVGKALP